MFWFVRKKEESSERWESGNPALFAGFPRDGGNGGKPVFGFPRFPRARLFHGSDEFSFLKKQNPQTPFGKPKGVCEPNHLNRTDHV